LRIASTAGEWTVAWDDELDEDDLEGRIKAAPHLTEAARTAALNALGRSDGWRSERRGEETARCILDLIWVAPPPPPIDLLAIRRHLEATHAGMSEVHTSLLDHLGMALWRRDRGLGGGPGLHLLLSGEPGVGKTSLAQAMSDAAGLHLIRIALGGATAITLAGSDQQYAFSQPGEIVRRLRQAKVHPSACLLLLDELDQASLEGSFPAGGVLLALLDPVQSGAFKDFYLPLPLDLSGMLVMATANTVSAIPPALRDRLHPIAIPAYTPEEQVAIGIQYLLPALRTSLGLGTGAGDAVRVADEVVAELVYHRPRVPGLRQLHRLLTQVLGRAIRVHLETGSLVLVDVATVRRWNAGTERPAGVIGFRRPLTAAPAPKPLPDRPGAPVLAVD
jgi:ATP-dependent Lon protease